MTLNWREALMIELHDAGVVVCQTNCAIAGWYEFFEIKKRYFLCGSGIEDLAMMLGLSNGEIQVIEEYAITGTTHQDHWGGGHEIVQLKAAEDGERLLIRLLCACEDQDNAGEYRHSITYRGSYTIWWAGDEPSQSWMTLDDEA